MKKCKSLILAAYSVLALSLSANAQSSFNLKTVYKDENVTFRELNDSTWLGSGNVMSSESMYLIEGKDKAVLTHVHPDHAGAVGCFDEVWIGPGDTVNISRDMPDYKGEVKYFRNRDIIDLGGRSLEVYFTPGHTPGSVTFLEKGTEYGYCGDSFGTGQGFKNAGILIFCEDLGTIINTCSESYRYFRDNGYRKLYCGHFYGDNFVTEERIRFVEEAVTRLKNGELEVSPYEGVFNLNRKAVYNGYKMRFVGSAEQP